MHNKHIRHRKRINISVTLVSESYVILYCEKKNVICNSSIKICLKKKAHQTSKLLLLFGFK
jgi:hypothetical protein